MQILVFLWLLLLAPLTVCAQNEAEIARFLSSRQVVGQVFFAVRTTQLTVESQKNIDKIVDTLTTYQKQDRLLRIEGFASTEGSDQANMTLSLQRALAVHEYLTEKHKIKIDVFLTGFGEKRIADGKLSSERRVDIAVYSKNSAAEALFDENGAVERYDLQ